MQEIVLFRPNLLDETNPLIKQNRQESNVELPFEGFDKETYPQVTRSRLPNSIEIIYEAFT